MKDKGRILFIQKDYFSLGVQYLATILKEDNYTVNAVLFKGDYFNLLPNFLNRKSYNRFLSHLRERIDILQPDIICFSTFTPTHLWHLEIAKYIKEYYTIPIIFGGVHATMSPDSILQDNAVDYICMGEAENVIIEMMEGILGGGRPDRHQ